MQSIKYSMSFLQFNSKKKLCYSYNTKYKQWFSVKVHIQSICFLMSYFKYGLICKQKFVQKVHFCQSKKKTNLF